MQPKRVEPSGMEDMFRSKLTSIINLKHPLVRLSHLIDWDRLEKHFAPYYADEGRPGVPIRLAVGLQLLKHAEGLSDESVCERWERDPFSIQYTSTASGAAPLYNLFSQHTHFRRPEVLPHVGGALPVHLRQAVAPSLKLCYSIKGLINPVR